MEKFKVFVINIKDREDRRINIENEFKNKKDIFNFNLIRTERCSNGASGLWINIKNILLKNIDSATDLIIICEDDHQFTSNYNNDVLINNINKCRKLNADILLGGISGFKTGIQIANNLFWIERFSGLQFSVIFKKFFNTILTTDFKENDQADYKISSLTKKKFVLVPFISIQKEYGYSDITQKNSNKGRVSKLFEDNNNRLNLLSKIRNKYTILK